MINKLPNPICLTQELVREKTITPIVANSLNILKKYLINANFQVIKLKFSEKNYNDVENLYAQIGKGKPHLCFAGHIDVVSPGLIKKWSYDPFSGQIDDNKIFGRGTSDMKGSIASFICAAVKYIKKNSNFKGTLSFLITGDEEGDAINGTRKVLKWITKQNIKFDHCIVGEPSNPSYIGEEIKIGRRGSMLGDLILYGIQGHIAYPYLADNPMPRLAIILNKLCNDTLDKGNNIFEPSNIEVTSIDVNNKDRNIIPENINIKFGIRYNNLYNFKDLKKLLKQKFDLVHQKFGGYYKIKYYHSGDAFYTKDKLLINLTSNAIGKYCKKNLKVTTTGGTSDARFIKNYCPTIEFGLTNKTIHKIDEYVNIQDINLLTKIYFEIINQYFKSKI